MANCIGLYGFIFGHNYKGVYDETEEQLSVEEKIILADKAYEHSEYDSIYDELTDAINSPKKITTIYIHHICSRCGDIKK